MRKEAMLLLLVIIAGGIALVWLGLKPKEEPKHICPKECSYGCLPMTTTCREPPCPSSCKLGCKAGTTECMPEVTVPKLKGVDSCEPLTENSALNLDLTSENTCLSIQSDNLLLDCRDHSVTGSIKQGSYGIYIKGRDNITIKNCVIQKYSSGIFIDSSSNIHLSNIVVNGNLDIGISITLSKDVVVDAIIASRNVWGGVELNSSSNITLSSSRIYENPYGLSITLSNGTRLLSDNICSSFAEDIRCDQADIIMDEMNICSRKSGCDINCSPC